MRTEEPSKRFAGAIRLFQIAGINVFLHWSWAIIAIFELQSRKGIYQSQVWNVLEYLTLFLIVLTHEFGHALACRSVGGKAERILLWPLGGVAYVSPPHRPGAVLWSIAAGPLVNVALVPVTFGLVWLAPSLGVRPGTDADAYLSMVAQINLGLLIFNMLPIYPLDGGQILQSLLWFFMGYARSLGVAAIVGMFGGAGLLSLAAISGNWFLVLISLFVLSLSWRGLASARAMAKSAIMPTAAPARCPGCGQSAPNGPYWQCSCGNTFDAFASNGVCPKCGATQPMTGCPMCGAYSPIAAWRNPGAVPRGV